MLPEYVLASLTPVPRLWNFYHTHEAALADKARAESKANVFENDVYTPMLYAEYLAGERAYWLADPLRRIDHEDYDDALSVLPPLCWNVYGGVSLFLMSEFQSATYTRQYAAYQRRYYCKIVDAEDQSTWITVPMIVAYEEGQNHGV